MAISYEVPLLSVLISPVGSNGGGGAFTVSETYAGLFSLRSDGGVGSGGDGFESLQFQGQDAFKSLTGPLEYLAFKNDGTLARGVGAAVDSRPDKELCGLTAQLRSVLLQNRMAGENLLRAPPSPKDAPVLLWRAEQGEAWKTIIPDRSPIVASVRHQTAPINRTVKLRSEKTWDASRGFVAEFDMGGVPQGHTSEPAVRFSWGDKFSLVFRGIGASKRPVLEQRKDAKWVQLNVLWDAAPLDAQFWNSIHTLRVYRCGGRMIYQLDALTLWIRELMDVGLESQIVGVKWPKAPLRLSVFGADCALQIHELTGETGQNDAKGQPKFIEVEIERTVPMPEAAPIGQTVGFKTSGYGVNPAPLFDGELKTLLRGDVLDRVKIEGEWEANSLNYSAKLTCSSIEAPLLCSFAAQFPPQAGAAHTWIEFAAAASNCTVDSGDPERLPLSEASFNFSRKMLDKLVPNWKTALLPYRPVVIRAKYQGDPEWTPLFRGYLTPESASRDTWGDYEIPMVALDPLVRLKAPAALIDERFGPLDLQLGEDYEELFGVQCVKHLLEVELGAQWVANFNGDGDLFRYLPNSPYPLMSRQAGGFFTGIQAPQTGSWQLPAPYGEDLLNWINALAEFDVAVWFYDASEDAFCYGTLFDFLSERGAKAWAIPETAPPSEIDTTKDFPLLSSLAISGLLEKAYNEVRVWGANSDETKGLAPSFIMGRAGDPPDPTSLDPLSVAQSWRRTYLQKPDFVKQGTATNEYANLLARTIWRQFEGKAPRRLDATFDTGFPLKARWGEILRLPASFLGPQYGGQSEDFRILQVKHSFDFSGGGGNRFSTSITTRSLSATGQ